MFRSTSGDVLPNQPVVLADLLWRQEPVLALAPMQDVTDLPFWRLLAERGGPDVYWTEYFRVHSTSRLDKTILKSLEENVTGRPAIAQIIGNDGDAMVSAARELQEYPVAAIDLNLGCPAPVVYRKCAGGGLLREPERIDQLLGRLRDAIGKYGVKFTVKTRLGFDSTEGFDGLLDIFARHSLDLLTVHGRTVLEMYRPPVHYEYIRRAAERMPCAVLANGNVDSPARACQVLDGTGARGLMIGRGCIRNPWLFEQIRFELNRSFQQRGQRWSGVEPGSAKLPTGREVLDYIHALWRATEPPDSIERLQVVQMKRYMNFIGEGVHSNPAVCDAFVYQIRRAVTRSEFFQICREFLDHSEPLDLVPPTKGERDIDLTADE